MLKRDFHHERRAQSFLEYTMVLTAVMLVLFAMNPLIKRGIQGMIKVAADQIGNQENADQAFGDSGFLQSSIGTSKSWMNKTRDEAIGNIMYIHDDLSTTYVTTTSDLGFSED